MSKSEIQYMDGDVERVDRIAIKASGWVKAWYTENGDEHTLHVPPHRIARIVGEANHQSPHGRI